MCLALSVGIVTISTPQRAQEWFSLALWLAGIGHFCVLIASFQVPARLGWKEDLQKLTPFNRKLMWVHGAFAVVTIVAFGTLTLALHNELLRGDRAAVALALFIGIYWALRVAVDFLYYEHKDWPLAGALSSWDILCLIYYLFISPQRIWRSSSGNPFQAERRSRPRSARHKSRQFTILSTSFLG